MFLIMPLCVVEEDDDEEEEEEEYEENSSSNRIVELWSNCFAQEESFSLSLSLSRKFRENK